MNLLRRAYPSIRFFLPRAADSTQTLNPILPSPVNRQQTLAAANRRRFYSSNHRHLQRFRPSTRPFWYENHGFLLCLAAAATYYFINLEPVPYTNRSHFVLLSPSSERKLGSFWFERRKASLKILPADHPASVRVRRIFSKVINARRYDPPTSYSTKASELFQRLVLRSVKPKEELEFEVIVAQDEYISAYCAPGGKIVVHTGLLDFFTSDAEIATVIGHEVGHAIARHSAEMPTKFLGFSILFESLFLPKFIVEMLMFLMELPYSRRMEKEADYIGLLLLASAGYDPRVAPLVYQKIEHGTKVTGWRGYLPAGWTDYLSTHPSSEDRAKALAQTEVMNKAMDIYWEVTNKGNEETRHIRGKTWKESLKLF